MKILRPAAFARGRSARVGRRRVVGGAATEQHLPLGHVDQLVAHPGRGADVGEALAGEGEHARGGAGEHAVVEAVAGTGDPPLAGRLAQLQHEVDGGLELSLRDGSAEHVAGVFTAATAAQRAPFAGQLGCGVLPSGGVEIDAMGRTTVPGVYAGGDMAHLAAVPGPMVSLAAAIASGQLAGASAVRDAIMP